MKSFPTVARNGTLQVNPVHSSYLRRHEGRRFRVALEVLESKGMRGFFEGACIPLYAYLNGLDYRNPDLLVALREQVVKPEFNGTVVVVDGKARKLGLSTKGRLHEVIDRFIDWMEEQYGIDRTQCLDPEDYKRFRDEIYPFSEYENYIAYLIDLKRLPAVYTARETARNVGLRLGDSQHGV